MDVDLIFKIAAIGILVAVLNQVLSRAGRDEQAMMTTTIISTYIAHLQYHPHLPLNGEKHL